MLKLDLGRAVVKFKGKSWIQSRTHAASEEVGQRGSRAAVGRDVGLKALQRLPIRESNTDGPMPQGFL